MPVAVAGPPASPALRAHQAAAPTAPPPTPLMPSSIAGVALNLGASERGGIRARPALTWTGRLLHVLLPCPAGIIFVAICYDYQALKTPDELSVALWQAHYFRKAVQPVLLMQGLQGLLFAGGLVNYSTKLIDVVRFKMSMAKRIIDLTGVGTPSGSCAGRVGRGSPSNVLGPLAYP